MTEPSAPPKPLRLWPGVVAALLLCLVRFVIPLFVPGANGLGMIGGFVGGLVIGIWWVFFSRAPWPERLGAPVLMAISLFATSHILHPSIRTGMMGMMFYFYAIPLLGLALVAATVASRRLPRGLRRASIIAAVLLVCGVFTLLRTGGMTGEAASDFHWRWTPTPEQRLLTQAAGQPKPPPPAPAPTALPTERVTAQPVDSTIQALTPAAETNLADWPGFRGPDRDGIARGARIETNWSKSPPVLMWRRPIGPGWSSFAVRGDLLYTQEQRGDDELVACYRVTSGEPVWQHGDAVRFWESNAGAGPRATPTLSHGRAYTFGATGILNALDATNGAVMWSRNVAADCDAKVPLWGFAGSPLVLEDIVIVAAAGRLAAYDLAAGKTRWLGATNGWGYSSPHLATIAGVAQVLLLNAAGAVSLAPADGTLLWSHSWKGDGIVQPAVMPDGDILLGSGSGFGSGAQVGVRRLAAARGPAGWTVEERWTSKGLKPYFNDFVVHKTHAIGFDGAMLSCIDLQDGKRMWKGGRYGNGQLLLLPEQDLLLVLSEAGELALVAADPNDFKEIARFPAISGKTWNHPVLVDGVLLVRNAEEIAAFRLAAPRQTP